MTPYEVLGVSSSSSAEDIKKAYHAKVRKYHPDVNPGDRLAEEAMKQVNRAFEDIQKKPKQTIQAPPRSVKTLDLWLSLEDLERHSRWNCDRLCVMNLTWGNPTDGQTFYSDNPNYYVKVHISAHKVFRRGTNPNNLYMLKECEQRHAKKGSVVSVTTIRGEHILVRLDRTVENGMHYRVANEGLSLFRGSTIRGNLYIKFLLKPNTPFIKRIFKGL
jgi:DnaJ-class molecular chaperone